MRPKDVYRRTRRALRLWEGQGVSLGRGIYRLARSRAVGAARPRVYAVRLSADLLRDSSISLKEYITAALARKILDDPDMQAAIAADEARLLYGDPVAKTPRGVLYAGAEA